MFRRNKTDYKAKLEHKLYLARENPESTFDLCECGLRQVPSGIYSLCRVFLKESLLLNNNKLTSLSGGGNLNDLCGLKLLNLQHNSFTLLPDNLSSLINLRELYLSHNNIKKLPESIGSFKNLRILDVSHNALRALPIELGNLTNLQRLFANGNIHLNHLPRSICRAKRIINLSVDSKDFVYPPSDIVAEGTESIMKYICHDNGFSYEPPSDVLEDDSINKETDEGDYVQVCPLQQQKLQEKLKFEKEYEMYQRQELELQAAIKTNRQKFLTDLTEQQTKLENELSKIQQKKEEERIRLIQELQDEELKADLAITNLLTLMREPLSQLLEQEYFEEQKLLAMAAKHTDALRKNDVLDAMRQLLEDETNRFKEYDQNREETARSILSQELMSDSHLAGVLKTQGKQQAELVSQLQMDMELQRIAVGALLERGDARSWSLVQQVHLVESQLAKLTTIEMDRRKLEMDEHLNDLAEKRANLSVLLVDLLEQQGVRRAQLLSTLQNLEEVGQSHEDFWLMQYQQLLDRKPVSLTDTQKNIDPEFAQELLFAGVIHYLPFLADWAQSADSENDLTDSDLQQAGIKNCDDRKLILHAYHQYSKLRSDGAKLAVAAASAPSPTPSSSSVVEPSAPFGSPAHSVELNRNNSFASTECVICMDAQCEMIFVPCGHMCCCANCASTIGECPLCRGHIERKIKVLLP